MSSGISGVEMDSATVAKISKSKAGDAFYLRPKTFQFSRFDINCVILSMVTYVLDVGMDIYAAYTYYTKSQVEYFYLTLAFVTIPAAIMTTFNLIWYSEDLTRRSCRRWTIRIFFLLFQLGPVLRCIDVLIYGIKSRKARVSNDKKQLEKNYVDLFNEEYYSMMTLRCIEGFMESAPQVTFQLYILIRHFNDPEDHSPLNSKYLHYLVIATSLLSLAWCQTALINYVRDDKNLYPQAKLLYLERLIQFLWHMCDICSRVLVFAVFAVKFSFLIIFVCFFHWIAMLAWLTFQGSQQYSNKYGDLVLAFIYVFTFFNNANEPTRYKYLTFYVILFIENTVLILSWCLLTSGSLWLLIVAHYLLFCLGVLFMVIFYAFIHPSVRVCSRQYTISY